MSYEEDVVRKFRPKGNDKIVRHQVIELPNRLDFIQERLLNENNGQTYKRTTKGN